jgi:hypothetical protein
MWKCFSLEGEQVERYQAFDSDEAVQEVTDLRLGVQRLVGAGGLLVGSVERARQRIVAGDVGREILDLIAVEVHVGGKIRHQSQMVVAGLTDDDFARDLKGADAENQQGDDAGHQQIADQFRRDVETKTHQRQITSDPSASTFTYRGWSREISLVSINMTCGTLSPLSRRTASATPWKPCSAAC